MSYLKAYKSRVGINGNTQTEIILNKNRVMFDRLITTSATSFKVAVSKPNEPCIDEDNLIECMIQDFAENDRNLGDEKVLLTRHDENLECGCYVN